MWSRSQCKTSRTTSCSPLFNGCVHCKGFGLHCQVSASLFLCYLRNKILLHIKESKRFRGAVKREILCFALRADESGGAAGLAQMRKTGGIFPVLTILPGCSLRDKISAAIRPANCRQKGLSVEMQSFSRIKTYQASYPTRHDAEKDSS